MIDPAQFSNHRRRLGRRMHCSDLFDEPTHLSYNHRALFGRPHAVGRVSENDGRPAARGQYSRFSGIMSLHLVWREQARAVRASCNSGCDANLSQSRAVVSQSMYRGAFGDSNPAVLWLQHWDISRQSSCNFVLQVGTLAETAN